MSQQRVVCGVVVFFARFGCGGVGLWADDSTTFKNENVNASAKIHGEGVECPRKPFEKAHGVRQKEARKKRVGVIDSRAADVPGVFPNLAVPVGIP